MSPTPEMLAARARVARRLELRAEAARQGRERMTPREIRDIQATLTNDAYWPGDS